MTSEKPMCERETDLAHGQGVRVEIRQDGRQPELVVPAMRLSLPSSLSLFLCLSLPSPLSLFLCLSPFLPLQAGLPLQVRSVANCTTQ
jgi:hypothetical protein